MKALDKNGLIAKLITIANQNSQELSDKSNLIALYFYNNSNHVAILLPTRATTRQKPLVYALFDGLGITPTRLIHFATKHIGLVFVSFDTNITTIMPIIFGFK